jgi:hypothetical protein
MYKNFIIATNKGSVSSGSGKALYSDNFNSYTTGTYLKDNSPWGSEESSYAGFQIYSGTACPSTGNISYNQLNYYNHTFANDQFSQMTAILPADSLTIYTGLSVRNSGAGTVNGYYWIGGTNDSYLGSLNNATDEWFATGGPWANGDTLKLEIVGNELRCYKNGSLDTTVSGDGKFTDVNNRHTSGYAGLSGYRGSILIGLDNWSGGDV